MTRRARHRVPLLLAAVTGAVMSPAGPAAADPLFADQYGLAQVGFPTAWATSTGEGVVIAVVDTGVDLTHPDLAGQLVTGADMVEPDTDPSDDNGHGTHVTGIAVAVTDNGIGIAGAAPAAKVMPIRVLDAQGAGDPATITEGIDWAVANGARVINLSLGGTGLSARLLKGGQINGAIRRAYEAGVVVVAAAGNDGAALRSYRFGVPVIVVNAVDGNASVAEFSNYGDARAVAAPGVDILSTSPTYASTLFGSDTSGYAALSGTSMAAPYVAAEAALLLAQGRSAAETIDLITGTATNPTADPQLGAGVIDAAAAVIAPSTGAAQPGPAPAPTADPLPTTGSSTAATAAIPAQRTSARVPTALAVAGAMAVLALAATVMLRAGSRRR